MDLPRSVEEEVQREVTQRVARTLENPWLVGDREVVRVFLEVQVLREKLAEQLARWGVEQPRTEEAE